MDIVGVGLNATDTLIPLPHFPASGSKVEFRSATVLPGGQVATAMVACQGWGLRPSIFWLLLGGFCWVIGDLFQQYATKYVGISRAIPLSNTNQLWGFAWGVLVFGELAGAHGSVRWLALLGSSITIAGAMLIAGATVSPDESASTTRAIRRECDRYGMDLEATLRAQHGHAEDAAIAEHRPWWDYLILLVALGVFVWAAVDARIPRLALHWTAALVLTVILLVVLAAVASFLWKKTRFA